MFSKRIERDQLATKKEQLEEALLNVKMRGAEQEKQLHQLQERINLLEEELAKAKLSKEYLVDQRHEKEVEAQYQETIRGLKMTLEGWKRRCQDIADDAEEQLRVATAKTPF
ncbi:hypothetical protein CR513_14514, partial [Mucuna pruriens]